MQDGHRTEWETLSGQRHSPGPRAGEWTRGAGEWSAGSERSEPWLPLTQEGVHLRQPSPPGPWPDTTARRESCPAVLGQQSTHVGPHTAPQKKATVAGNWLLRFRKSAVVAEHAASQAPNNGVLGKESETVNIMSPPPPRAGAVAL
jgi:hypothetical protein